MAELLTLALLGESLLIDTIEANLRTQQGFNVVRVSGDNDVLESCDWRMPDMVIADMQPCQRATLVGHLASLPGVPVLAVDASSDKAVALSCEHYTIRTSDDLARVIRRQVAPPDRYSTEGLNSAFGLAKLSQIVQSADARHQNPPEKKF